jgi:uncharacterized pyridoxamine 5'-phosphate oxidase family protein
VERNQIIALIQKTRIGYLATVDASHTPRVRPIDAGVVLDGEVCFSTFSNSRKVSHLESNPRVEVVWLSEEMEQVRLSGEAVAVEDEITRQRYLRENPSAAQMFEGEVSSKYRLYRIGQVKAEYMGPDDAGYQDVAW